MKKQIDDADDALLSGPKRKTTHSLPISVLDRLRIYSAVLNRDQQDVIALLLDQQLPKSPYPQAEKIVA